MSTTSAVNKSQVQRNAGAEILRSVKVFFGLRIRNPYNKSRIIRRPSKSYEEFIFKGYDQQHSALLKSAAFKKIRLIGKN